MIIGATVGATEPDAAGSGEVRNPHDAAHSAGMATAAAVAAGQVPCSIDLQSDGMIVEAASFCGVFGFKPTSGIIARTGSRYRSQTLDQIGLFARSLSDVALLADALAGFDPTDPQSYAAPKPAMRAGVAAEAPVAPCFAAFDEAIAEDLREEMQTGLAELADALGDQAEMLPTPKSFTEVLAASATVRSYECSARKISDAYRHAIAMAAGARDYFETFFADYDAVISAPACGAAPMCGDNPADPGWSTVWSFAGLPCLSLPILRSAAGLPAGIQLTGGREEDDRLLRTASWLERHLAMEDDTNSA